MFVVMDTRGTYSSNPLNVSLEAFEPIIGAYPTCESEYQDFRESTARVVKSWEENSSPPGILRHIGTREFVQDYEQIRKSLGYERIHVLGDSYGTFRSLQYASTYSDRVDRIALDSVVPHGLSLFDQAQYQVAALNRLLLRADAYCQNDKTCPFKDQGKGSIVRVGSFRACTTDASS
jgi:pimeloyl-ACP methyl ester carboxylesterase